MEHDTSITHIERDVLYERVWSSPLSHLAREYGVTCQRLKALCTQAGIPTPPAGYWMKLAAGKPVSRAPLPVSPWGAEVVTISPSPRLRNASLSKRLAQTDKAETAENESKKGVVLPKLHVPSKLRKPHPIIDSWLEERERLIKDRRDFPRFGPAIEPFSKLERRRHRILDTFFKAIEKTGGEVRKGDKQKLEVKLQGEWIAFQVREKSKKVQRPLTDKEKNYSWNSDKEWIRELQPSGNLVFEFKRYLPQGFRQDWLETKDTPLEEYLPAIFETLTQAASILAFQTKRQREENKRREEEKREKERKRQTLQRDENQWLRFMELADSWQRYEQTQAFVKALKQQPLDSSITIGDKSLEAWVSWAEDKLETYHPLKRGVDKLFEDIEHVTHTTYPKPSSRNR